MLNILFTFSIIIFLFYIIVHIYNTNKIFKRLKSHHNDIWITLGAPKFQISFGDDRYKNIMKYIREHKFENLDDCVLEAHYKSLRFAEKVGLYNAIIIISIVILDVVIAQK
ncbi:MAG: hypothetical protein GQ570_02990 [Helicobacteraceae bacterium]|nr:hypothetical protein [Helicobacteraceae bacterium]